MNKIDEQTVLIKAQTKEIKHQSNKIDILNEWLIDNNGRLTGKEVKDTKLLMIYKDVNYNEFDKHNTDTNILPLRIVRRQFINMSKEQKNIYNNKSYLFATNLPEAISQNKSILKIILDNDDIGQYFDIVNKGGITKINIKLIDYLNDYYNNNYIVKKNTAINRRINELIEQFIRLYKIELQRATKNKIFKEYSDDEDNEDDNNKVATS